MNGFRYLAEDLTLDVNSETCVGCGICLTVCPHGVYQIQDRKAVMVTRDACMECGACALNCPVRAISVVADVGCTSGMINRWLSRFNIRMDSGDCC